MTSPKGNLITPVLFDTSGDIKPLKGDLLESMIVFDKHHAIWSYPNVLQILIDNIAQNVAVIVYTVPANTIAFISLIHTSLFNNTGAIQAANAVIANNGAFGNATFTLWGIAQDGEVQSNSFIPPIKLIAGATISTVSTAVNAFSKVAIHGYTLPITGL